ncbi:hypothetical protein ASPZODRAFT_133119 [Penicilliopsis zonata CBS 506.65]|uniref:Uncharacterized protein n=1 Tax=Penicilliopsis zonata CBS 506.65 TaxID=1073090 RepID=A0A1L9SG24_9EURO|nr:hypothetical protein ASPZODRAFT_133119 [Penicilliopsis zonata CBS 506.65]OJJ46121.1 hypothetical protein ASPZODRAFT_133119 [Penicilliopsis zonata CBS 506.65]
MSDSGQMKRVQNECELMQSVLLRTLLVTKTCGCRVMSSCHACLVMEVVIRGKRRNGTCQNRNKSMSNIQGENKKKKRKRNMTNDSTRREKRKEKRRWMACSANPPKQTESLSVDCLVRFQPESSPVEPNHATRK